MKFKFLVSLMLLGGSLSALAQGYKDGIEYYKVNKLENAKELLERNFNNADTKKDEVHYYLGCIALKEGKTAEAKDNFEKGLAVNPESALNKIGLGVIALKNNDSERAKKLFEEVQKANKKDAEIEALIARAYTEADPVAYAKQIEKATKNAYKYGKNLNPDIYILEGDVEAGKKNWGEAAGKYELAINADNGNVEAYVKYANVYYNVAPDMAIQKLIEIRDKKPESALVQRELAEKYYDNNQWAKAAREYKTYLDLPNHFTQDRNRYAFLLFYGKMYDESLALAKELVAENPNNFYMKRMSLYNLVAMKNWAEAEATAVDLFNSTLPEGVKFEAKDYTDYATALKELGKTDEALAQYEKAVELNPEKTELLKEISDAYLNAQNFAKSAEYYQQYIDKGDAKLQDKFTLSQRYYYAALSDSVPETKEAALNKSIQYAQEVNEKAATPSTRILHQIAQCEQLKEKMNNTILEGTAMPAVDALLEMLESKPENKQNPSRIREYIFVYQHKIVYYSAIATQIKKEDKNYKTNENYISCMDKMKEAYVLWLEVDPNNQGLREFVEKMNAEKK